MSKHKFTADRSDMAHNIKRALLGSTAVQPPPVVATERWGDSGVPVATDLRTAMKELISSGEVIIKEKPRGA